MNVKIVGSKCCACKNCEIVCPKLAIRFELDAFGSEYPRIDTDTCVECGLCVASCPMVHKPLFSDNTVKKCGFAFALDSQCKLQGSSGGLFGILARDTLNRGGIVYGAAFDDALKLKTTAAESVSDLQPLYKSKYLLCDTNGKFAEIKNHLKSGRLVLYCSSPCQVAALKLYLAKEYHNLLTVEFVCHGVGSQSLFDRSLSYVEKKHGIQISDFIFRYKIKSAASSHYYRYSYKSKGKTKHKEDIYLTFPYYNAYCKQLANRSGCYDCEYADKSRCADITIGDFHNIRKYNKHIDRFAGVSMFLCNSEKGKLYFDWIINDLYIEEMDPETLYANNRFSNSDKKPSHEPSFKQSLCEDPFDVTVKKYLAPSKNWKDMLYYRMPECIRNLIRKVTGR